MKSLAMRHADVRGRDVVQVDFVLEQDVPILSGSVRTKKGATLREMVVTLSPRGRGSDNAWHAAITDGQGEFAFLSLEPGTYDLFTTPDQGRSVTFRKTVEITEEPERLRIVLPDHSLSGQLLTAGSENPVVAAQVVLSRIEPNGEQTFAAKTQSDTKGRYRFDRLSPGEYIGVAYPTRDSLGHQPISRGPGSGSHASTESVPRTGRYVRHPHRGPKRCARSRSARRLAPRRRCPRARERSHSSPMKMVTAFIRMRDTGAGP